MRIIWLIIRNMFLLSKQTHTSFSIMLNLSPLIGCTHFQCCIKQFKLYFSRSAAVHIYLSSWAALCWWHHWATRWCCTHMSLTLSMWAWIFPIKSSTCSCSATQRGKKKHLNEYGRNEVWVSVLLIRKTLPGVVCKKGAEKRERSHLQEKEKESSQQDKQRVGIVSTSLVMISVSYWWWAE